MGLSADALRVIGSRMERHPHPPLSPAHVWNPAIDRQLDARAETGLFDGSISDPTFARAALCGLNLLNDNLDDMHRKAAQLSRQSGSSADDRVRAALERLDAWDPFVFSDLCARHEANESPGQELLLAIQMGEIDELLRFCICMEEAAGYA